MMTADEIIAYENGWVWNPTIEREIDNIVDDAIHAVEMHHEIMTPQQIADDQAEERVQRRRLVYQEGFAEQEVAVEL